MTQQTVEKKDCEHDYRYRDDTDLDRETYVCLKCGDFYRLYYEDMR